MKNLITLFLLLVLSTGHAYAAEVRVVDQSGLTRAVQKIRPGTAVVVRVEIIPQTGANPEYISLQLDARPDVQIEASQRKDQSYEFAGVGQGIWRIAAETGIKLQSVQIFK